MGATVMTSGKPLGAEVRGIDIGRGVTSDEFDYIRNAVHQHSVVVLRDQHLTPAQQVEFCGRFGPIEPHILNQFLVPGSKDLVLVSNVLDEEGKPIGLIDAGQLWHTDGHFQLLPNLYSMLYALEVPTDETGQPLGATLFVSTAYAYEQLSQRTKQRIEGLQALNSISAVYEALRRKNPNGKRPPLTAQQMQEAVHPVVRTHPVTGRKCIYVSRAATIRILELPEAESDALIEELSAWCVRDEFVYEHKWQVGDLLIWDNCSAQHSVVTDYALPKRRLLHRATIGGSVPF